MSRKEFLKEMAVAFFVITTLVNVAIFVLGSVFNREARFGYDAFLSPMVYAAFSLLPVGVTYSKRELSVKEIIVRKIIQLVLIEVVLFLLSFGLGSLHGQNPALLVSFGLSVAVIYGLVEVISFLVASKEAKTLTRELKTFQEN